MENKVPHYAAPTRDHIIPLASGGEDIMKNCRLACFLCNSMKGNRKIAGGEQLLLFGR